MHWRGEPIYIEPYTKYLLGSPADSIKQLYVYWQLRILFYACAKSFNDFRRTKCIKHNKDMCLILLNVYICLELFIYEDGPYNNPGKMKYSVEDSDSFCGFDIIL